jgi:hypothetical protein
LPVTKDPRVLYVLPRREGRRDQENTVLSCPFESDVMTTDPAASAMVTGGERSTS